MNKKNLQILLAAASLIVLFSLLVYPTPYKYVQYGTQGKVVKINIFTGKTMIMTDNGWYILRDGGWEKKE